MLFVLSAFSCMQCACWFAFSSVDPAFVKAFMGSAVANDATIGLLLNWGPIVGVVTAPLQIRLGASRSGFRASVVGGAWLVFAGSLLRLAPCLARARVASFRPRRGVHRESHRSASTGAARGGARARSTRARSSTRPRVRSAWARSRA